MTPGTPLYEFLTSLLARNMVFGGLLGVFPLWCLNRSITISVIGGSITSIAIILTAIAGWGISLLFAGTASAAYVGPVCIALVIAAITPATGAIFNRISPSHHAQMRDYLGYLTTNTAVMGMGLFALIPGSHTGVQPDFSGYMAGATGSALGYIAAVVVMAGIRTRIRPGKGHPHAMDGIPSFLLAAGVVSLVFLGFSFLGTLAGGR